MCYDKQTKCTEQTDVKNGYTKTDKLLNHQLTAVYFIRTIMTIFVSITDIIQLNTTTVSTSPFVTATISCEVNNNNHNLVFKR